MKLTEHQTTVYRQICSFIMQDDTQEFVLKGAGGTGKGVILTHIYNNYSSFKSDISVMDAGRKHWVTLISATTNEAAKVLRDKGIHDSKTIFSLAGLRVTNGKLVATKRPNTDNLIIFVDEASYINEETRELILDQFPNSKIIWILDQAQLAPVGFTHSVVDKLDCFQTELTEILRSQGELQKFNTYLRECVLKGINPDLAPWHNGDTICIVDKEGFRNEVHTQFSDRNWTPAKSRVLGFTNKKCGFYGYYIMKEVQGRESAFEEGSYLRQSGYSKAIKDGEIVRVNTYSETALNGVPILRINGHMQLATNSYQNRKKVQEVGYTLDQFVNLQPVQSMTTHKAQGSTIHTVLVDKEDIENAYTKCREMYRRLLYTAVSRASDRVIIRV